MNVELICVGSELLSGDVVNTNAAYISQKLQELGHDSFRQFTVDDNKYRLSELVEQALKRCDILIVTGGLGPTADDITRDVCCEVMGFEMNEGMMAMMGGFTVLRLTSMVGMMNISFTKEELLKMNKQLNRIRKPKK